MINPAGSQDWKSVTNSFHQDSFNSSTNANPDGIGNCLQQPGPIRNKSKVYHRNLHQLIKFLVS